MLPAMSDIAQHVPDAQIDWIVEENFTDIPGWHAAVRDVIPVAHRRWRKNWWAAATRAERRELRRTLATRRYDMILDMQGLIKYVLQLRLDKRDRHGSDLSYICECLDSLLS